MIHDKLISYFFSGTADSDDVSSAVKVVNGNSETKGKQESKPAKMTNGINGHSNVTNKRDIISTRSPIHSLSSLDSSPSLEETYGRLVHNTNGPPAPIVTNSRLHLLWPQPRTITQLHNDSWIVPKTLTFGIIAGGASVLSMCQVIEVHREAIEECGVTVVVCGALQHTAAQSITTRYTTPAAPYKIISTNADVVCCISAAMRTTPLRYTFSLTSKGVRIHCGSINSLHSALATLVQLLLIHSRSEKNDIENKEQFDGSMLDVNSLSELSIDERRSSISVPLLRQTSEPVHISMGPTTKVSLSRCQSEDKVRPSSLSSVSEEPVLDNNTAIQIDSVMIDDCPDVPHRAFMLDAAPLARIPALKTLFYFVDTLLSLKMNELHLMMTIQMNQHDKENTGSSLCHCHLPYSAADVLQLSQYCNARGVTLVPAFDLDSSLPTGRLVGYLPVSELTSAVSDAVACFPDSKTVSIGPTLTSVLVSYSVCQPSCNPWQCLGVDTNIGTLILCSNIFQKANHLYQYIPLTAVLMEYGFQANYDFAVATDGIADRDGRALAVCPGTAAWSSLSGFPEAGVSNVFRGCVKTTSPSAIVVAHWSTPASLTPLVFVWPAVVVAAGLSWNSNTHYDYVNSSLSELIDTHLVRIPNSGFGAALVELGRCETWLTRQMRQQSDTDLSNLPPISTGPGSILHQLLADPDAVFLEHLKAEKFGSLIRHVKRSVRSIVNNRVVQSHWLLMPVAAAELNLSADLMMTAARLGRALVTVGSNPRSNLGMAVVNPGLSNLPPTLRTDVANRLLSLRESYSCLWLHCHQPAGLQASLLLLSSLLTRLLPHQPDIHQL